MRTRIASAVAFLLFASTAVAASAPTSAIVQVSWDVSLDAAGNVTQLSTRDERVPKLHARLEKAIRGWRFSPGKINGEPAATQTHLQAKLEIRLVDDAFEVRLVSAFTGTDYRKRGVPQYPVGAARAGKQGGVMLVAHYGAAGAVESVAPYEIRPEVDTRLVQAAMSSVKKWTFAPEVVGGRPLAGDALIPVCFHLEGHSEPDCGLKNAVTGEAMNGGEAVALNPAAKLESDVIGHTL